MSLTTVRTHMLLIHHPSTVLRSLRGSLSRLGLFAGDISVPAVRKAT